jgi:hypothetical protein
MVEGHRHRLHLILSPRGEAAAFAAVASLLKAVVMPFVMLKRNWPGNFRRTITIGKKGKETKKVLEFSPGLPVDLTAAEVEALRPDIGIALLPVDFDEKGRPRVITDEVVPEETEPANEPAQVN